MNLTFREDYWDSPRYKKEFINFLKKIFGLDLSLWDNLGFWDNNYRPFSLFDGDRLVSNVCVYTMDMTVMGTKCKVAQISAVGTLQEYRRKGLSLRLMSDAIAWARDKHDFFYLGSDREAFPLYEKCGFRLVDEYRQRLSTRGKEPKPGAAKLDMQNREHIQQIYWLASKREPVSDMLGVSNERLFMYWCLYSLNNFIHYIPALDILVLYKRENGLVTVFDIVGAKMPKFTEVYSYICHSEDKTADFLFMTDKIELGNLDYIKDVEPGLHILGNFPLDGIKFIFPFTSHA